MSDADEIIQALNRNTQQLRELTEEGRRLREALEKVIAVEPHKKKDRLENAIEGLAPIAAALLRGEGKRKR